MDRVKPLGLGPAQPVEPHRHDAEALVFDPSDHLARQTLLDAVRFYDRQRALHLSRNLVALGGRVQRAHLGPRDVAASNLQPPRLGHNGLDHLVGDAVEHVHPFDRQAGLSAVVETAHARGAGGGGQVRVVADDHRV